MKKFDTLKNIGTSKVFFAIALGRDKVIDIAEFVGTERTTVYDQIKRLELIRLIKAKPKRKGFEIDLVKFYALFLDEFIKNTYEELFEDMNMPEEFIKKFCEHKLELSRAFKVMKILDKDKKFKKDFFGLYNLLYILKKKFILKELIINYIKNIANEFKDNKKKINFTLKDCIDDFQTAIPSLLSKYKNKENKNQKLILKCINELHNIFLKMSAPATEALEKSFKEIK